MTSQIYTVEQIEARCREIGVGINELCHEAKVNRSILVRWKKEPPKSFKILENIHQALDRLAELPDATKLQELGIIAPSVEALCKTE